MLVSVYLLATRRYVLLTAFTILINIGQRFALREGGKTVGAGVVSKVMS